MLGSTVSHYRILRSIAAGGMGVVYLAHDENLERDVAIKVLPPGALSDEDARRRFRREALTLSKLNHPNVATIFDFDSDGDTDFLVAEYVAGPALDEKLRGGALPITEVISLGIQLANGLAAAHAQNIVHRDLKPANLRLTPDGRLKILDFGIALLVHPETDLARTMTMNSSQLVTGTFPYMSPEQLRGEPVDARCDIWAAGAVLYELTTGRRPFQNANGPMLIDSIFNHPPEAPSSINPKVTPYLENIILKCLEKEPQRRYQSVPELAGDLERISTGTRPAIAQAHRKKWWTIALAGTAVAILMIMGALYWRSSSRVKTRTAAVVATRAERPSIAVLGFKNLSGRPESAWLSTALSEMLTTELGAGEHLLTISGENVARVRQDLSLPEVDALAPDTLERLRKNLGSDFVVLGSYLDLGGTNRPIRVDLRLQDAAAGQTIAAVSEKGTESQLDALVISAGSKLLQKLGFSESPETAQPAVRASMPANLEAARAYAEGLQKLRSYDVLAARDLFQKAVAADPSFAPAWGALSSSWRTLGFNTKAKDAAQRALELSSKLGREDRLLIEGQFYTASNQNGKAVDSYRSLFGLFPDNVDHGIRLAEAQVYAGHANDALTTIGQLRNLPAPRNQDLRIDLAETRAAHALSDYKREQQSAARLAAKSQEQGARQMIASARLSECLALRNLGDPKAAVPACEEAQHISAAAGDQFGVAKALNALGNTYYDGGDLERAKAAYRESARISREIGSEGALAGALDNLASVVGDQGDTAQATKLSEESLALYRRVDDKINISATLNNIAAELVSQGHLASALKLFEESLAIGRKIGSESSVGTALNNIGDVYLALGDLGAAQQAYQQSYDAFVKNEERAKSAYPANGLGEVLFQRGELPAAKAQFQKALDLSKDADKHESAAILYRLGKLALQQADFSAAKKQFDGSIAMRSELGERDLLLDSQIAAAQLSYEERQLEQAEAALRACVNDAVQQKSIEQQIDARTLLAEVMAQRAEVQQAQSQIQAAETLAVHSEIRFARLRLRIASARVQIAAHQPDAAIGILNRAIAEAQKSGMLILQLHARLTLGEAQLAAGKQAAGRETLAGVRKESTDRGLMLLARRAERAAS